MGEEYSKEREMREAGESVSSAGPRSGRSRGESGKGGSRTDCNCDGNTVESFSQGNHVI